MVDGWLATQTTLKSVGGKGDSITCLCDNPVSGDLLHAMYLLCLQEYRGHDRVSTAHPLKRIMPTGYLLPTSFTSTCYVRNVGYARIHGMTPHIPYTIYVHWPHCLPSLRTLQKRAASVLLFSLEGAGESVSYSTSAEQDGERGGSGEGGTIPHINKSERSCVAYCPPDDDCSRGDWRVCPPQ